MSLVNFRPPLFEPPEIKLLGFALLLRRHWFSDQAIEIEIPKSVMQAFDHRPNVFREIFSDCLLDRGVGVETLVSICVVPNEEFTARYRENPKI